MDVDEARGDDQSFCFDTFPRRFPLEHTKSDNSSIPNPNIGHLSGLPRAIENMTSGDEKIEGASIL